MPAERDGDLADAVSLVKELSPDLLLTNVYVPGSTGREAAMLLKSLCPHLRTLLVAGLPDEDQIMAAMTDGGLQFFAKPFTASDLTAKVQQVLAEQPQDGEKALHS